MPLFRQRVSGNAGDLNLMHGIYHSRRRTGLGENSTGGCDCIERGARAAKLLWNHCGEQAVFTHGVDSFGRKPRVAIYGFSKPGARLRDNESGFV